MINRKPNIATNTNRRSTFLAWFTSTAFRSTVWNRAFIAIPFIATTSFYIISFDGVICLQKSIFQG
jgi:hypothetical protein